MTHDAFDAWAPEGALWSPWVKPVLFAQRSSVESDGETATAPEPANLRWLPATGQTVVVVDLPGATSVLTGITLARRGYRPVPLYNTSVGPSPLVDVLPVVRELVNGVPVVRQLSLPLDAPPAFLLDANRMRPSVPPTAGKFDNRWLVFPQDFPSAMFLRAHGLSEVVLLHDAGGLQEDLAHVLLRWQESGLRIMSTTTETAPRELTVKKPSWYRRAWYRAISTAGLHRNNAGGFGAVIPVRSTGGYG